MPTLEVSRKKGRGVRCETDGFLTTRSLVRKGKGKRGFTGGSYKMVVR